MLYKEPFALGTPAIRVSTLPPPISRVLCGSTFSHTRLVVRSLISGGSILRSFSRSTWSTYRALVSLASEKRKPSSSLKSSSKKVEGLWRYRLSHRNLCGRFLSSFRSNSACPYRSSAYASSTATEATEGGIVSDF